MADRTWSFLQRSGTTTKLGIIIEVEGGVLGRNAVGAHHTGPRKVKLRQVGGTHWKAKQRLRDLDREDN